MPPVYPAKKRESKLWILFFELTRDCDEHLVVEINLPRSVEGTGVRRSESDNDLLAAWMGIQNFKSGVVIHETISDLEVFCSNGDETVLLLFKKVQHL